MAAAASPRRASVRALCARGSPPATRPCARCGRCGDDLAAGSGRGVLAAVRRWAGVAHAAARARAWRGAEGEGRARETEDVRARARVVTTCLARALVTEGRAFSQRERGGEGSASVRGERARPDVGAMELARQGPWLFAGCLRSRVAHAARLLSKRPFINNRFTSTRATAVSFAAPTTAHPIDARAARQESRHTAKSAHRSDRSL